MAVDLRARDEMHQHERVGRAAVQQRERHRRVARMRDAALAFHEQQAVAAGAAVTFEHELFGRAAREIGDHAIDRRAPAGDRDAGLPGRHEFRRDVRRLCRAREFERRSHLADGAIAADGQHDTARHVVGGARKQRRGGRHAQIPDARIVPVGERAELGVLAEERVQAVHHFEPGLQCDRDLGAVVVRQFAAGGRDADQERRRAVREACGDGGDDRRVGVEVGDDIPHAFAGVARIDHGDRRVARIRDDAVRGFRRAIAERTRREDDVASRHAATARSFTPSPGPAGSTILPPS